MSDFLPKRGRDSNAVLYPIIIILVAILAIAIFWVFKSDSTVIGLINNGSAYFSQGEYADALKKFEEAAKEDPANPDILGWIVRTKAKLGDLEGSDRAVEDLKRLRPDDPAVYEVAGDVEVAKKRYAEALSDFRRLEERRPRDVQVILKIAQVYMMMEDFGGAQAEYERILAIDSTNGEAKRGLQSARVSVGRSSQSKLPSYADEGGIEQISTGLGEGAIEPLSTDLPSGDE